MAGNSRSGECAGGWELLEQAVHPNGKNLTPGVCFPAQVEMQKGR